LKLRVLNNALERVGIDPDPVRPLRVVPPERRRARLGMIRPSDPRLPALIGFRERFRHDLVDLRECPVLEPALFAVVDELRLVACDLMPPGGTAEVTLTRTDSGIDALLEAPDRPRLGALEALAAFAEKYDLARIVWRLPGEEILVVERRSVRVLLSGVAVPYPPGVFLQASAAAEAILVDETLAGIGPHRPVLDLYAGLGNFTFALAAAGPVHAVEGDERAVAALARAAAGQRGITVGLSGISCAAGRLNQSGHSQCEALAKEDGELGLGHGPLARRHDPLLFGAVQDQGAWWRLRQWGNDPWREPPGAAWN
jgi:23S rRNA (uracil1939-C5)-methyltransferase